MIKSSIDNDRPIKLTKSEKEFISGLVDKIIKRSMKI